LIVAADTSVVLNLAWLRQDRLWPELFDRVLAPPAVQAEFQRLVLADHRFHGLRFPEFIFIEPSGALPHVLTANEDLDPGEVAVLALALDRGIRHVLIDEAAGRRAALALGLQPSGLLGLLVEAKKRALIPAVLPLLDHLRDRARFHVGDDLRQRIAGLAGETS
jgi:predicted nucleic acid-binding protein